MRNFSQNLQIQQYHLYIINMNQKYFSLKAVQKFWKNWEYPKGDTRRQWRHTRGLESVALAIPIFGTYVLKYNPKQAPNHLAVGVGTGVRWDHRYWYICSNKYYSSTFFCELSRFFFIYAPNFMHFTYEFNFFLFFFCSAYFTNIT